MALRAASLTPPAIGGDIMPYLILWLLGMPLTVVILLALVL
ncbi:hypothetical protein [Thalassobaculum salexigens]|nr:hypothetical protein [Thalassobaculum salexigens]